MKNAVSVHCDSGANGSGAAGSVENPPVGIVVNECATASKRFMFGSMRVQPQNASSPISTNVRAM